MFHKIILLILLLVPLSGFARHLRSGEISYRPVPGQPNTYEITVTIYTNSVATNGADQPNVSIKFGDGSSQTVLRSNGIPGTYNGVRYNHMGVLISPTIRINIYTTTHTFPGNNSYIISIEPSARNYGIVNMPTGDINMYVASMLTIGSNLTPMSSPVLSLPPIGDGCIDAIYKINPGAIDPDGDILRFQLQKCKTVRGADIQGYLFPNDIDPAARSLFTMNPTTGIIVWDRPTVQGEYNISFKIEKWRNGVLIGYVLRDMQVTIAPCPNKPPIIDPIPDVCVEAGTIINFKVTISDPDDDTLTFITTGMPYDVPVSPAKFTLQGTNIGSTSGTFNWSTNALHFRKNPYQVFYKLEDIHQGSSLTDVASNFITIIGPSVKNVSASVYQRGFNVKWDPSVTTQETGYNIYRQTGTSAFITDSCTQGVPLNSGYSLISTVNDPTKLSFIDSNNGKGLASGYTYCYIVTAIFADGAKSSPSQPYCSPLMIPFIKLIKDTLIACQWNTLKIDSTIIKFESTDLSTSYSWSSSPEIQLTNANKPEVDAKLNAAGIYEVKLVATSGAYTDNAKITIRVYPIPDPKIMLNDLGGLPDSVMFYNKSPNAVRAEWLFPDGTRSSRQDSVLHVFEDNGYFRIYLKVFNLLGCPDTTSVLYRVVMKGIAMPNAFEPENPDDKLNRFRPVAIGLQTYYLGIWDLWGNLVWESDKLDLTRPAEGWDGSDKKGNKMPSQNYIWRMKATYIDGTMWKGVKDHFGKLHSEGTLNLLR